jgi:arylsulfatase A-like enzyme
MRTLTKLTALLFMLLFMLCGSVAGASQRPNIIVMMADDLGYGDVSCYGATKIQTPNIDRLASQGMKFTDAHSAASVCSPSRYGLMTGRSPWRLHRKGNGYKLEPGRMTLASLAKDHGYRSAAIGKWHLGYGSDWDSPLSPGPLESGFDYHFGVPTNHNDQYRAYVENHDFVGLKPGQQLRVVKGQPFPSGLAEPRIEDQVDTTLTGKAIDFIREHAEQPFFLYFTPCAPHTHITPAASFRGTSRAGLFGDYIQELDAHVGEILGTLDDLRIADETFVVFTSDNGSTPKDFKGTQNVVLNLADESYDLRVKFKSAKADAKLMGHVTNGPWHDGKGSAYEGGHRVPFIARWPGKIAPASSSSQTLCLTDLMATIADILDAPLPDDAGEDSFSALPVLTGKPSPHLRTTAFIQGDTKDNAIAIRSGTWKLIESTNSKNQKVHQLYDLTTDPGETKDLAPENQETVKQLSAALAKARADGRSR